MFGLLLGGKIHENIAFLFAPSGENSPTQTKI
jgi:hypothetical protein